MLTFTIIGEVVIHIQRARVFAMGRAWQEAQLSGIALIGFFFLQLTKSPNKFV